MLVDANVLIYAVDTASPAHARASAWIESALNGPTRVGLPWESLTAFVRIVTNPRAMQEPMDPDDAWEIVRAWTDEDITWHPGPTDRHGHVLGSLICDLRLTANRIPDAHLAAIAIQHGLDVVSADSDFALFSNRLRWINPLDEP